MKTISFTVPFFYELNVIRKRCHNAVPVIVKGIHTVSLKSVSPADVAHSFDVDFCLPGEQDTQHIFTIPLVDGRLYQFAPAHLTQALIEDINQSGFNNPFARVAENKGSFTKHIINEEDIPAQDFREVLANKRSAVTENLDAIAKHYVIAGDKTYTPIGEPYYYVNQMGLGNNHGGTVLNVGYTYKGKPQLEPAFNAGQREEAQAYADSVAAGRGDTKSIGTGPLYIITVHRPDDIDLPCAVIED